jgi:hypothetical protein
LHPADSLHGEQLQDKLSILHGLVFDLRQGVDDLRFRLEVNTEKIELFLQLLSSLQAAVPTDPGGETSKPEPMDDFEDVQADKRKEPGATTHGKDTGKQSSEGLVKQKIGSELRAEPQTKDTENTSQSNDDTAKGNEQWGDGTTIVEEEPWPGDLQGTWPGYVSRV